MSHEVETMFYTREKPWHGLGERVEEALCSNDALTMAGLDWLVNQKPIFTGDGDLIKGYKANIRSKDEKVLGIVTDRYTVVQNQEAFAFTDALIEEGIKYESTMLNGQYYSVIDNPEDGSTDVLGDYVGSNKFIGSITVTINGVSTICNHFGTMGDAWYSLKKEKSAKEDELKNLKAKPDCLSASELAAYGDDNSIVMQIGNPYICAYGSPRVIDANNTVPIVVNGGSTLLPIRAIIESSYGTVDWDSASGAVTIALGGTVIQLKNNSTTATINGNTVAMTTPAQTINSRLMVPLRFVAENFGMTVEWKSDVKVIVINNPNYENDLLASNLTLSNSYYTYTDSAAGCSFSYPEKWGKPTVTVTHESNWDYIHLLFTTNYARISESYKCIPTDAEISKVTNPEGDFEAVQLSSSNTGVTAMAKTTEAYGKNASSGEVLILGENGYLHSFSWFLITMDSGLSQTEHEVLDVVKTLSLQAAAG